MVTALLHSLGDGRSIRVDRPILLVGRSPNCDVVLDSKKVSRQHCCIARVKDHLVVRDLGSTNGIRVNGMKLEEGKLKAGDELTIGNCRYRLEFRADSEDEPLPPHRISDAELSKADVPIPLGEPERGVLPARPQVIGEDSQRADTPSAPDDPPKAPPADSGWIVADSWVRPADPADSDFQFRRGER